MLLKTNTWNYDSWNITWPTDERSSSDHDQVQAAHAPRLDDGGHEGREQRRQQHKRRQRSELEMLCLFILTYLF